MISAPLRSRASTTTVARAEPGDDAVAGRESPRRGLDARRVLRDDQPVAAIARASSACAARVVAVDAAAEHGDGAAARLERAAVRLARRSPRARPLTTTSPAAASSRPSVARDERPYAEHARAPTIATAGRASSSSRAVAAQEQARRRIGDRAEERREARGPSAPRKRKPASASRRRYARSSKLRTNAGPATRRSAGRTRCAPVSDGERGERELVHAVELPRRPVGERLGDVLGQDGVGAGERGDRARDAGDARAAATGERQPFDGAVEQLVAPRRCERGARRARRLARGSTTRARDGRRRLRRARPRAPRARPRHRDDEVEAVEQRARELVAVRRDPLRRARARRAPDRRAPPQGHRFIVATSWKRAGKSARPPTRATETTPSSSGWRSASSAGRGNSASSSRSSTPRCARLASPGPGPAPPPTIAAAEAPWCGARNGGARMSGCPAASRPGDGVDARHLERRLAVERRQDARQPPGEHRLARAGRACEQQVVLARGGELERSPCALLAAHVGEVGRGNGSSARRPAASGSAARARRGGTRPPRARWRSRTDSMPASAASARRLGGAEDALEPRAPRAFGDGERAADRPQPTVERELADACVPRRAASGGSCCDAARSASAIGRSKPEPSLRSAAGARLTVIRPARATRARPRRCRCARAACASWQARSASPTIENAGRPSLRGRASTSTRRGSRPTSAWVSARASTLRRYAEMCDDFVPASSAKRARRARLRSTRRRGGRCGG